VPWSIIAFSAFPGFLRPGDLLVLNNSRVIPARLRGFKPDTGGEIEILLLEENGPLDWWVMLRPGQAGSVGYEDHLPHPRWSGITVAGGGAGQK